MKIYSYTSQAPEDAMKFIQYMNKLMGKDLWVYAENKRWGSGYFIHFIRTYIEGKDTHVISNAVYVDDINDIENMKPLDSSIAELASEESIAEWMSLHEYDLTLSEMTNCYRIHAPVEIMTTDDIIEMCKRAEE